MGTYGATLAAEEAPAEELQPYHSELVALLEAGLALVDDAVVAGVVVAGRVVELTVDRTL